MKRIFPAVLFVLCCLTVGQNRASAASICTAVTPNLVANCGFETGDFTSWTLAGNDVPLEQNILYGVEGTDPLDGISPNSGSYQAFFADLVDSSTTLSQTIATNSGQLYRVQWYLAQDTAPVTPYTNAFSASFGGTTLISLSAMPVQGYTEYSADVEALSSSSTLAFTLGNDVGEFLLDDISVGNVPEPASWLFMLGAGALWGLTAWRRSVSKMAR